MHAWYCCLISCSELAVHDRLPVATSPLASTLFLHLKFSPSCVIHLHACLYSFYASTNRLCPSIHICSRLYFWTKVCSFGQLLDGTGYASLHTNLRSARDSRCRLLGDASLPAQMAVVFDLHHGRRPYLVVVELSFSAFVLDGV